MEIKDWRSAVAKLKQRVRALESRPASEEGLELLASYEVSGSAVSSISFSNISGEGFVVYMYAKLDGNGNTYMRFNNDSGNNYATKDLQGDGATASSGTFGGVVNAIPVTSTYTNLTGVAMLYVGKPLTTTVGFVTGNTGSGNGLYNLASSWNNTSAQITRIDFVISTSAKFSAGTQVAIYGWSV